MANIVRISRPQSTAPVEDAPFEPWRQISQRRVQAAKKAAKKGLPPKLDSHTVIHYDQLNKTELLALSTLVGIPGRSPVVSREALVDALTNLESIDATNPIDKIKRRLVSWMRRPEIWEKIQMQSPGNIFDLLERSDYWVAFFYLKNKDKMT